MVMSDEEKTLTAYHEAGHAIVGLEMPGHDPLHKVTIIPRGRALGLTMRLPERDRLSYNKQFCIGNLASVFGGREAEILIFGPDMVTNGAMGDIQQATRLARAMVMEWGMSEKLGSVRYSSNQEEVFLGHSVTQTTNISPETSKLIDEEVRRLIEDGEQTARRVLTERLADLHVVAKALLELETLSGEEVKALLRGEKINRPDPLDSSGEPDKRRKSSVPTSSGPATGGINPEPQPGV